MLRSVGFSLACNKQINSKYTTTFMFVQEPYREQRFNVSKNVLLLHCFVNRHNMHRSLNFMTGCKLFCGLQIPVQANTFRLVSISGLNVDWCVYPDTDPANRLSAFPAAVKPAPFATRVLISLQPDQEGKKLMFLSELREFPSAPCLPRKKLDDSLRLDIIEIARVPDIFPCFFPSWSV